MQYFILKSSTGTIKFTRKIPISSIQELGDLLYFLYVTNQLAVGRWQECHTFLTATQNTQQTISDMVLDFGELIHYTQLIH